MRHGRLLATGDADVVDAENTAWTERCSEEVAGLEAGFAPTKLAVATDREKLARIIQNLLRNAVQHGRGRLAVQLCPARDGALLQVTNGVEDRQRIDTAQLLDRF